MQMNLPGSVIGACSRAEPAGTVTHSLMPAAVSSTSGPPSRNARVLLGTSAAAISAARVIPRRVRDAATLAWRSAIRSPCRTPSRGVWPLVEKRTSFMCDGPPGSECAADYSVCRVYVPRAVCYDRGLPELLRWRAPEGGQYLPEACLGRRLVMKTG